MVCCRLVPWEALLSKDEEDRLSREGKLPKSSHTEIVLSKDSKIVGKEKAAEAVPGVSKVEDMETLRARLDIRARSLEMLDLVRYGTMRLLSDKYYGKVNAVVADGMRTPSLNEVRRFDREMQVHVFRHLSRGVGSLEGAISLGALEAFSPNNDLNVPNSSGGGPVSITKAFISL